MTFKETFKTALQLVKEKPSVYALTALMFVLPASLMVNIQSTKVPEDVTSLEASLMIQVLLPLLLWSLVAALFTMVGFLIISVYVMRSRYQSENEQFGEDLQGQDYFTYLSLAFKAFPRAVLTEAVLFGALCLLAMMVSYMMNMAPAMLILFMVPVLVAFLFYQMYRYGSICMSVRVRVFGFQLIVGSQVVLKEKIWKSFGQFAAIYAMTMVPSLILRFVASFLLDYIENTILMIGLASLCDTVFSILELFLVTFMSVRIHRALKEALSIDNQG